MRSTSYLFPSSARTYVDHKRHGKHFGNCRMHCTDVAAHVERIHIVISRAPRDLPIQHPHEMLLVAWSLPYSDRLWLDWFEAVTVAMALALRKLGATTGECHRRKAAKATAYTVLHRLYLYSTVGIAIEKKITFVQVRVQILQFALWPAARELLYS
jgi:hypothetical protein